MPGWPKTLQTLLLAVSLGLVSAGAGWLAWNTLESGSDQTPASLLVLPEPRVIADFRLIDEQQQTFSLDDFKGHWSVLFFGFTHCPDICPNTLYQLKQARQEMLEAGKPSNPPDFYLVSVDPERDTPQKLNEYLAYFDPTFRGLTGDAAQLKALTFQLGVMYHIEDHGADDTEYTVDHSASLLLLNPAGKLHGVFPTPHNVETIVADLVKAIDGGNGAGGG